MKSVVRFLLFLFAGLCFAISALAQTPPVNLFVADQELLPGEADLVKATEKLLTENLPRRGLVVEHGTEKELRRRLEENAVDLFLSSSAFYRKNMRPFGASMVASIVPDAAGEPEDSMGSLVLARMGDKGLNRLADLIHKNVGYLPQFGFRGFQTALSELPSNTSLDKWFASVNGYTNPNELLEALSSGKIDAAFLPACFLENADVSANPLGIRPLAPVAGSTLACLHSSPLYPGPVLAATKKLPSSTLVRITATVYGVDGKDLDYAWGLPINFSELDSLLKKLGQDDYSHLKENLLASLWKNHKPWLLAGLVLFCLICCHSVVVNYLVRKRTAQLTRTLKEKEFLREKEKENALRLEELQKVGIVGLMSSLFAHEIRQPLSAVGCWSYALKGMVAKDMPKEKLLETVGLVSDQVKRIEEVVQRIRTYAKSKQKRRETVCLEDIVQNAIDSVVGSATKTVDFQWKRGHQDHKVDVDPFEIEIALVNVFRNSLDAQKDSSKPVIKVVEVKENGSVGLVVTDHGPSLEDDQLEKLKSPFHTTKSSGMGLGLAVVRSIFVRHGGTFSLARSPRGGLQVTLLLPIFQEPLTDETVGQNN